ncbi:MAG: histidine kinase [Pyrinomonadaceae bacterium]
MADGGSIINILGFAVGIALYGLLFFMVYGEGARAKKSDPLLLAAAVLGLVWNLGEFASFVLRESGGGRPPTFFTAAAFTCLGFLPAVAVNSADPVDSKISPLSATAYLLGATAMFFHLSAWLDGSEVPSATGLLILTLGSFAIAVLLLLVGLFRGIGHKLIWIGSLLIFGFSSLHLRSDLEMSSWIFELIAHQSSLPLVVAILIQDYRFAFADLFLKRALSLAILSLTAFGLYSYIGVPLQSLHGSHSEQDTVSTGVFLLLWIATALLYPRIHDLSVWLVDKIVLRRVSFGALQNRVAESIGSCDDELEVLEIVGGELAAVLASGAGNYRVLDGFASGRDLVSVQGNHVRLDIPTHDSPQYGVDFSRPAGARRLLSDETAVLETIAARTASRIDAIRAIEERLRTERRANELSRMKTEAELTALRAQLNPHFLFNALNTIGYLIRSAPEKASGTLLRLTNLLRTTLSDKQRLSTLRQEMTLVEDYLEIEKTRFEERLSVQIDVTEEALKARVPSLVVQPIVENAIKHGISQNEEGGVVRIEGKVHPNKGTLEVVVSNTEGNGGMAKGTGIGIENIRKRLESLYEKGAGFELGSGDAGMTTARIWVPINSEPKSDG